MLPDAKGLIDLRGRGLLQERGQISESKMVNVVHQLWIVSGKATAPFSLSWRDKLATERSSTSDVELFRTFLRLSGCQSQNLSCCVSRGRISASMHRKAKNQGGNPGPAKARLFVYSRFGFGQGISRRCR